jgi:hypothetical protein
MNGVIFGEVERLSLAKGLSISADLLFWQRKPLPFAGHYNFSQELVELNETEMAFDSALYVPYEIQRSMLNNNYTFQLDRYCFYIETFFSLQSIFRSVQYWETAAVLENSTFTIRFDFLIHEQLLLYRTGALELLKWLWIQYFALSILIRVLFDTLTSFMFQNNLLGSIVYCDDAKSKVH